MIDCDDWIWSGRPGHFIDADRCLFRLCTDIGSVRVSTIGAYYPKDDYEEMITLGFERHYETMVFNLSKGGEINNWTEIDAESIKLEKNESAKAADKRAEKMHMRMCWKWANNV